MGLRDIRVYIPGHKREARGDLQGVVYVLRMGSHVSPRSASSPPGAQISESSSSRDDTMESSQIPPLNRIQKRELIHYVIPASFEQEQPLTQFVFLAVYRAR